MRHLRLLESAGAQKREYLEELARRMTARLRHRGPDDSGVWVDPAQGLALGHCRLAILDLSAEGHQPMVSSSGRLVVVFNGEIYNHQELRAELAAAGHAFRGHSDTEMLLEACEQWGLSKALCRFVGMFAFALWDVPNRTLHLARDRIGEKPLYYAWLGHTLVFGSELRALQAHPSWRGSLDAHATTAMLHYGYVPSPRSIYREARKLPPASLLSYAAANIQEQASPVQYWSLRQTVEAGEARPFQGSTDEARSGLENLLRQSIRQQMIADVPVGAFLSGGVDSSAVVALMQAESPGSVRTFSVGFSDHRFNEAALARAIAKHLGTKHTEMLVTSRDALDLIPSLPSIYDEPLGDSSQIPTVLISRLTRQHVTVALSGDGGDELFGGYNRHSWIRNLACWHRRLPRGCRKQLAVALRGLPARWFGSRVSKLAHILERDWPFGACHAMVAAWHGRDALFQDSAVIPSVSSAGRACVGKHQRSHQPYAVP